VADFALFLLWTSACFLAGVALAAAFAGAAFGSAFGYSGYSYFSVYA
jgi:hypothetical protein